MSTTFGTHGGARCVEVKTERLEINSDFKNIKKVFCFLFLFFYFFSSSPYYCNEGEVAEDEEDEEDDDEADEADAAFAFDAFFVYE